MEQLQWMLSLIPDSVLVYIYTIVLLAGLAGLAVGKIIRWIPGISPYRIPIKIVGALLTVLGVFLFGGYGVELSWRAKVAEMQAKVDAAAAQSALANRSIADDLNKKTEEVKQKTETIVKYVDRYRDREVLKTIEGPERVRVEEVIKYVENCPVPQEFINIHNDAAKLNKKPEGEKK